MAREIAAEDETGLEDAFLEHVADGRVTWGARVRNFYEVEELAFRIMDRHLLRGDSLSRAAREIAEEVDRVLGR